MNTAPKEPLSRRELLARITILASEGHSAPEIAKVLNENPRRVERVARDHGVRLAGRGGYRKVHCGVRRRHYERLESLAGVLDVSKSVALERLLRVALDKSITVILKDLGKEARPKRKYKPRARKLG